VLDIASAQGEASAGIRRFEERVQVFALTRQDLVDSGGQPLAPGRDIGAQDFELFRLRLLDGRLPRRGLRLLCQCDARRSCQSDQCE
jgi:hypothetical protein